MSSGFSAAPTATARDTGRAMSRENIEVVRRVLDAWEQGDGSRVIEGLDPAVELVTDPGWPEQGIISGPEEVLRFLEDYREAFESRATTVEKVVDGRDRVVVRVVDTVTGRASGVPTENAFSVAYTLRRGKIARIEYFWDHTEALHAAGLRE